jgi:hypothetical protein
MRVMKNFLLTAATLLALASPAIAQHVSHPQPDAYQPTVANMWSVLGWVYRPHLNCPDGDYQVCSVQDPTGTPLIICSRRSEPFSLRVEKCEA